MEIKLTDKDKIRIDSVGQPTNRPFIDIAGESNDSDFHANDGLSVAFYNMHQFFILRKDEYFKLFLFPKESTVLMSDFGFYEDGEIVFTNSYVNTL